MISNKIRLNILEIINLIYNAIKTALKEVALLQLPSPIVHNR